MTAFNSFNFWFTFLIVFLLYWAIPAKWNMWRKVFLVRNRVFSQLAYFKEAMHFNDKGAREFSKRIAHDLKQELKN